MDFCPVCGVAVDVAMEDGDCVYICRNRACEKYGEQVQNLEEGVNHV